MVRKSKMSATPTKSKSPSKSKPKTPTIMKIDEALSPIKAILPANLVNVAANTEAINAFVESPSKLRALLLVLMIATVVTALVLYIIGHKESKDKAVAAYTTRIPGYFFDPWFAILLLLASSFGYIFILMSLKRVTFLFVLISATYMASLLVLFYTLYFDFKASNSIPQIFSVILLVDTLLFVTVITQDCDHYTLPILALAPTITFAGFVLFFSGIIRE